MLFICASKKFENAWLQNKIITGKTICYVTKNLSKVKQKVSGCFRAEIYAKAYCRISGYLQTMGNKGINPLVAIQMALSRELNIGCK